MESDGNNEDNKTATDFEPTCPSLMLPMNKQEKNKTTTYVYVYKCIGLSYYTITEASIFKPTFRTGFLLSSQFVIPVILAKCGWKRGDVTL